MKNKPFFWIGICLSPFFLGLLWLLQSKPEAQKIEGLPKKSLLGINFIPSKLKQTVSQQEFLLLAADPTQLSIKKKMEDFLGKPVMVHFWATWCGACVEEIPQIEAFAKAYGNNFHLLMIAADEITGKAVRDFYEKKKITNFAIYIDEKGEFAKEMKAMALPTTVFVNAKGCEEGRIIGPVDWNGEAGKLLQAELSANK